MALKGVQWGLRAQWGLKECSETEESAVGLKGVQWGLRECSGA